MLHYAIVCDIRLQTSCHILMMHPSTIADLFRQFPFAARRGR